MLPADYAAMLDGLKERIRNERLRVTITANSAMILLYWDIGFSMSRKLSKMAGAGIFW